MIGVDDDVSDLDQSYLIQFDATSSDPDYEAISIGSILMLNVDDDLLMGTPAVLDFGSVAVGSPSSVLTWTITNVSPTTATSHLGGLSVMNTVDFVVVANDCTPQAFPNGLLPMDTCQVQVRMAPTTATPIDGGLELNAERGGTVRASLTGTGTPASALSIFPNTWDVGDLAVAATAVHSFMLVNSGADLTNVLITASAPELTISTPTTGFGCTSTLASGAFCNFTLSFTAPATIGFLSRSVSVSADVAASTQLGITAVVVP